MESCKEKRSKELIEFINFVKKANGPRVHKVRNSYGVYDAYKWIRKNGWLDIGRCLTEHEFYSIIRKVNDYLADSFLQGNDIELPHKMGRIELRKYDAKVRVVRGKVKTNLPIDWSRTLRLWYEDEEAYKEKTLIRREVKEIFMVYYNKQLAGYKNKFFYDFNANRELKRRLTQRIKEGKIDAFKMEIE